MAHGLKPGARLSALMNGKRRTLVVEGIALSPEYIFAGLWGMPDQRGFGVFWIDARDAGGGVRHAGRVQPRRDPPRAQGRRSAR